MSAFIVDTEHIDVLVWAGLHFGSPYGVRWPVPNSNPTVYRELDITSADAVGTMLLAENTRSVNYRYSETEAAPVYVYRTPRFTTWSATEVLKAISCLDYQSCETPDWAETEARAYLDALQSTLIHSLPGMDTAPWEIDTAKVPAANLAVRV